MLRWLPLLMTASVVWLSVLLPCQGTFLLEDLGPMTYVVQDEFVTWMSAIAGSLWLWSPILWCQVRCWEVQDNGQTVPKAQQMHTGPVLDACWSDVSLLSKIIPSVNKPSYAKILNHLLCASSNRTGAKFSPRPVTKQPKCGISTATKPCRLHRLDKRSGPCGCIFKIRIVSHFFGVSLYSTTVPSNRFTGLKLQTIAASWPAAGTRHWR